MAIFVWLGSSCNSAYGSCSHDPALIWSMKGANRRPEPVGPAAARDEVPTAFIAFVLRHAECADELVERRLGERLVVC